MKNRIKLFLVGVLTILVTASYAQNYIIKGGLNLSNMVFKDDERTYSQDLKMNTGFNVGATIELPVDDHFSFETGLILSTKGYMLEGDETFKSSLDLYYLDIPITWKGYLNVGEAKVYGVLGPYIGIGLSGTDKLTITYDGQSETIKEKIEWGSVGAEDDFERMDLGMIFGGGLEFKKVQLGVSYSLGLTSILPYQGYDRVVKNRVLSISMGYIFCNRQIDMQ